MQHITNELACLPLISFSTLKQLFWITDSRRLINRNTPTQAQHLNIKVQKRERNSLLEIKAAGMMSGRKIFFHGNLERLLRSQNVNFHYATINQIQTPMGKRLDGEVNTTDFI